MALTKVKGSGLATGAATASLVGIDDNATSTAITIDASENVGVGQTSPITKLDASQDNIGGNVALGIFQSGNAYGNVASSASLYLGATYHSLANSAKITSTHSSGTTGDHAQDLTFNPINAGSTSFEAMRIDSSGNVKVNTGNLVIGTSGKGIDFSASADGTGTVTSEVLDDYEEGTWTPNLTGTGGGAYTHSIKTGIYTKIGNLVTVHCSIVNCTTVTTGSGNMIITGLPFTVSGSEYRNASVFRARQGNGTYTDMFIAAGENSTTMYPTHSNNMSGDGTNIPAAAIAASLDIGFTYTYRVD